LGGFVVDVPDDSGVSVVAVAVVDEIGATTDKAPADAAGPSVAAAISLFDS
jgi:hypothetical protein